MFSSNTRLKYTKYNSQKSNHVKVCKSVILISNKKFALKSFIETKVRFFCIISVLNTSVMHRKPLPKVHVIYLVLTEGFNIMLYETISVYFTVIYSYETWKSLPRNSMRVMFSFLNQKRCSTKVFWCKNSDL